MNTTKKRMKAIVLIALLLGMVTTGWAADRVKGNGKLTAKTITIDDYNEVRVDGVIDFSYEQSETTPHMEVTVDENLHQYVNIEIKDRVLTIGFKGAKVDHFTKFIVTSNSKWLKKAKITGNGNFSVKSPLTGDELEIKANANSLIQLTKLVKVGKLDLEVSGSANMVVSNLQADKIECDIDGSGSVTLKEGKAKEGEYSIVSSGDIHAFGLEVAELSCKITGNGLAEVRPTENLKASIVGKGNIRYKGPTAVQQKIIGKGTVEEVK